MAEPTAGIVRVLTPKSETAGAAFLASDDGLLVTCAHVVDQAAAADGSVEVTFLSAPEARRRARVEPACSSPADAVDLSVLRLLDRPPAGATPFVLGSSAGSLDGDFHTFGFPAVKPVEGLAGKVEVTGTTVENGSRVLQLRSNEVSRGFSGAPVWDDLGAVIGIVVSIVPAGADPAGKQSEVSFVRPVESLLELCPRLRPATASPYRGLDPFEEEHAGSYFGRDAAARELLAALAANDFVAVVGVSGSGKSSLVRAGLAKALSESRAHPAARLLRRVVTPGADPLASALGSGPEPLLVVVDQLERLFTEYDADARRSFVELLVGGSLGVKTVVALRADFYDRALNEPRLGEAIKAGSQVTLLSMSERELREAIVEPARLGHRGVEPRLVDALVNDVSGRAGDLPLLEFALTELWQADADRGVLTLASYERLGGAGGEGGVGGALAGYADDVWSTLAEDERRAAKAVLLRLVGAGATIDGAARSVDTSRRARLAELDGPAQEVAAKLAEARLLTAGRDPGGEPTVEVAHEALIRAWPLLRDWVEREADFVRWYDDDLRPFLRSWEEQGRSDDQLVLRGAPLAEAERWLRDHGDELAGPAAEFIARNVAAAERERAAERRSATIFRRAALALLALLALVGALAGLAVEQRSDARHAQKTAESAALAERSLLRLSDDPNASLHLAIRAADKAKTPEALDALRAALLESRLAASLRGHGRPVRDVAFSRDGRLVATAGDDGTVRVWRSSGWHRPQVLGATGGPAVLSAAFSPKGDRLAAGDQSGTVRIWSLPDGRATPLQPRLPDWALSVAFDADGSLLAGASADGTVRIWDLAGNGPGRVVHAGRKAVNGVGFDSHRLVTAGEDGRVRVWDVRTGAKNVATLSARGAAFTSASLAGNGLVLAAARDGVARLWRLPGRQPIATFHAGSLLYDAAFARGGTLIVTAGKDGKAEVWSRRTRSLVTVLRGHRGSVFAVAASGSVIATASIDGSAGIWRAPVDPIVLGGHPHGVTSVVFTPKRKLVVTTGGDGRARLWSETGRLLRVLPGSALEIRAVDATRDGGLLAAAGLDGNARLWRLPDGAQDGVLSHPAPVTSVAFDRDGRLLATGCEDGVVRLWTVARPDRPPRVLARETASVTSVAFSADGSLLAAGGEDSSVRLWQTADWTPLPPIRNRGVVTRVAFSPDGKLVAGAGDNGVTLARTTGEHLADLAVGPVDSVVFAPDGDRVLLAAEDGTASIWSADGRRRLALLEGHSDPVNRAAFDRDGTVVVTAGADGTARLWDAGSGGSVGVVARHGGPVADAVFSPDAKLIATAGEDGSARIVPCEVCAPFDALLETARSRVAQ